MGCVYQAQNMINGKVYIGKTIGSLKNRIASHHSLMRNGSNYYFYQAMRKYGKDNFKWTELFQSDDEKQLSEKEIMFIKSLGTLKPFGYNLSEGGEGQKGYHHTDEAKRKIGLAGIGRQKTAEGRERIRQSKLGVPLSKEHREKLKKARAKRVISNETREKLRLAGMGRVFSEETIAKMKKSREGYKHSSETIAKLIGHPVSQQTRERIRVARTGAKSSSHTKQKISESIKKHWILRKLRMEADKNESRFVGIAC